jgi:hypothetical protein
MCAKYESCTNYFERIIDLKEILFERNPELQGNQKLYGHPPLVEWAYNTN